MVNTMIVVTNGVTFGPGVTRMVTVSSSTAGLQNPATGKLVLQSWDHWRGEGVGGLGRLGNGGHRVYRIIIN